MQTLLQTVYSDSTKHFVSKPYPRKEDTIQISLRVKENLILQQVFLRYKKQGVEIVEEMTKTETLNDLSYYQADALCLDDYLSYQFYLTTKEAIIFTPKQVSATICQMIVTILKFIQTTMLLNGYPRRFFTKSCQTVLLMDDQK